MGIKEPIVIHRKELDKVFLTDLNFDGLNSLYEKAKVLNKNITRKEVKQYLSENAIQQQTTIKPKKAEFKPIYSESFYSYQCDLTFFPRFKKQNGGNYVLFTAININSRYAYAYYSKDKAAKTVQEMLDKFLHNALIVENLTMDSGSEFTDKANIEWFKKHNIETYFVVGDSHKLGIINRFHRTLKDKLTKYFLTYNTAKWIDFIDKIIKNYNNTTIRTTGFTPLDASKHFIQTLIINKAKERTEKIEANEPEFNVGQLCRVKVKNKLFDRLKLKYSKEIYMITKVNHNTVDLKDINNNKVLSDVKTSEILIISSATIHKNSDAIDIANKEAKSGRNFQKEGLDSSNVLYTRRRG